MIKIKYYNFVIIIILLLSILVRFLSLSSAPPGFDYDEGIWDLIFLFKKLSGLTSLSNKIIILSSYIAHPQIPILLLINKIDPNILVHLSIDKFFLIFRISHSLIGAVLLLVVFIFGRKILVNINYLNNNYYLILYTLYISFAMPILIHLSRTVSLTKVLLFAYGTYLLLTSVLKIKESKALYSKRTLHFRILAGYFLYFITFLTDIKSVFYVSFSALFFIIILLNILDTKKEKYIYMCLLISSFLLSILLELSNSSVYTKILHGASFMPSNILPYFHYDYLFISGGRLFLEPLVQPFSWLGDYTSCYRWNACVGVLGPLGILIYAIPLLLVKVIKKLRSLYGKIYLKWFIVMFLSYILSLSFTKYDNPVSVRHLYFYIFVPLTLVLMLKAILDQRSSRQVKILKSLILVIVIIYSAIASVYYFNYYPSVPYVKYRFLESEHKLLINAMDVLTNPSIKQYMKNDNIKNVHLLYIALNRSRLKYINFGAICNLYRSFIEFKLKHTNVFCSISDLQYLSNEKSLKITINNLLNGNNNELIFFIFENSNSRIIKEIFQYTVDTFNNEYKILKVWQMKLSMNIYLEIPEKNKLVSVKKTSLILVIILLHNR